MNRIWCAALCSWIWIGVSAVTHAQSLSTELLAEGTAALAKAAREHGDSVRGAILYPQKELRCTVCHGPGAADLLGPDLTQTPKDVLDEHFVESILQPSKVIKKGFESVKVLTVDGRVIVGRIVANNDHDFVIRDTSETSRLIHLPKAGVDQILANEKSAMPDDLANLLTDRQQFLDLVKYVMDIAGTGEATDGLPVPNTTDDRIVDDRIQGLVLLDRFHCASCHRADQGDPISGKQAPELTTSTARIDPRFIQDFIANPPLVKPGTNMPDVMGHLAENEKRDAAEAITHYLISLTSQSFRRQAIDQLSAGRGNELFHTVGCVACHAPRGDDAQERTTNDSVPLGRIDSKYSVDSLVAFLENPHLVRPAGRMPNMVLSHWEAVDIANYLLQHPVGVNDDRDRYERRPLERSLVATGKRHFAELGCIHCHQKDSAPPPFPSMESLRPERGCLSSQSGAWPRYELDESQIESIRTSLRQRADRFTDRQQIALTMAMFRCFACHQRDHWGGVADDRDEYFQTTNENLGPQGRIPPALTLVGAKLKPKWMREVLVSGRSIRPYMKTRMPQFGTNNVVPLVDLFQRVDELPEVEFGRRADPEEVRKVGTELVGSGGLNCIACHTFQQKLSQTMPAVDLTEMAERLHKQWFYQYMRSPQSLSPGTVMPSFWPGGQAIRKDILDGNTNQQIEAVWEYLLDGRQARVPRGLHREAIELLATDGQAVMLRRSYQGIGKRGIGVGYPGGVNLAFDAEQMRIAMIWKGKFADPGAVWGGQGSGNVRPLGSDLVRFGAGPELDDAQSPWVVDQGRPPKHQFTGYFLDQIGRPTFTYRFDGVEVEDQVLDVKDERSGDTGFQRTLTFNCQQPVGSLAFRVATSDRISRENDHTYRIGRSLRIRVGDDRQASIVDTGAEKHLVIPLQLPGGTSKLVLDYAW